MTTQSPTAIDRARAYLGKIPGAIAGQSGHNETFKAACILVHGFALSRSDALTLLQEWNRTCQPPWSQRELEHKIDDASRAHHDQPCGYLLGDGIVRYRQHFTPRPRQPRPSVDPVTATENYLKGFRAGEVDVWEASPLRPLDNWQLDGLILIEALYQAGERINFVAKFERETVKDGSMRARPDGIGETWERDALLTHWTANGMPAGEAGAWLRMNPVDGAGVADANVTAFRFMLLESDALPLELQLSLFCRLPLPVAAIFSSGGKSLHCWVQVDAKDAAEYRDTVTRVLAPLARFGIDGKNKNPARLSRLPGVHRQIGAHGDGCQRLLYLNPQSEQRRIFQ